MKLKKLILKIITSNIDGKLYEDKIRRSIIVNLFTLVGFFSLLLFGIDGIIHEKYLYTIIVSVFLIIDLVIFVLHQIKHNTKFASFFIVFSFFILELLLLVYLGVGYTGLFWFYVFPIYAIFMLGRHMGSTLSILLIILAALYIKYPFEHFIYYNPAIIARFVFVYLVVLSMSYIVEIVREKIITALKASDNQKTQYLRKIVQQSEELNVQKEELNEKNIELQKLSIIASETQNAILIADENYEVEWVNEAFTNIYGYTLEEYQKKCADVIVCSGDKDTLQKCIKNKTSVDYINSTFDKNGRKIWVQTTVTPIVDKNNSIKKLIFLESDITEQKKIEEEITEKNFELNQQKEEILVQKDLLQKKNDLISSYNNAVRQSISYSLKIQKSILPPKYIINSIFKNFILLKPKDIVSGDFYWFYENKDSYFFAAVDCTGHGVPGAFMSIIGIRLLNEIVAVEKHKDPAKILKLLHEKFFLTLDQQHNLNFDGMDIIFVSLLKDESTNNTIYYAGAKRPLIYFDYKAKDVVLLKTTRKSIGGIQSEFNNEIFVTKSIKIPKNSMIYLTSDGFIDQHNDARKRIGTPKLLEIIRKINNMTVREQYKFFLDFVKKYKQNQRQTDDILIWGIRL